MVGGKCRMAAASRVGCRIGKGYNSIKGGWVGADAATAPGLARLCRKLARGLGTRPHGGRKMPNGCGKPSRLPHRKRLQQN